MKLDDFLLGIVQVFGDGVAQVQAALPHVTAIERLQALAMRRQKEPDKPVDYFVRPAAVKAGHPKLGRGVRDQGKFAAREEDRPGAAHDLAEGVEQRFEQVHRAAGGLFVGQLGRCKNLQILGHEPGAEQRARKPLNRLAVAAGDLRHLGNATAQVLERGDVLLVRRDDLGGLIVCHHAQVLKMADDVNGGQFVEREEGGLIELVSGAALEIAAHRGQQTPGDQRVG